MNKEQKEAVWLLGLGTFLEYFDLMLYVHMAFFLNELFFPPVETNKAFLVSALTFCSSFIFRPFSAIIFGWLGDNVGRKTTVTITTIMMAISSIIIAVLPTYAEIGVTATWIIIICRILQGMSSLGEVVGAELYITEITKPPVQYVAVASIAIFATIGGICALGGGYLFTTFHLDWRKLFWLGAIVGIIGIFARINLRETIDFIDAKRRMKRILEKTSIKSISYNPILQGKINKKTFMALLLIHTAWPLYFYFSYIYCGNILKTTFGFSSNQVIFQNFIVGLVELSGYLFLAIGSYTINPLVFIRGKIIIFFPFCLILPYLLNHLNNSFELLLIQSFIMLFTFCYTPAMPIFLKHFQVFGRFTAASLTYAISRTIIYIVTSFGFVYLEQFGKWSLLLMIIPVNVGFIWGIQHFLYLERLKNSHPSRKG